MRSCLLVVFCFAACFAAPPRFTITLHGLVGEGLNETVHVHATEIILSGSDATDGDIIGSNNTIIAHAELKNCDEINNIIATSQDTIIARDDKGRLVIHLPKHGAIDVKA